MATTAATRADREEVLELYARYAILIDGARYEEWVGLFTDDGIFESARFGRHSGREGLRKFTALYKESLGGAQPRHVITNVCVEIDGERASGVCYLSYYHCKSGRAELSAIGTYKDELRKAGGVWRFKSRQVAIDGGR